ncbi:hypothetical protein [Streptomyces sp. NPDC006012]|uniref:hypothetical protein n=1 Tax=Streptomyces sp. NPDC006012 TaxID=3364739 RepID=UPI0036C4EF4E
MRLWLLRLAIGLMLFALAVGGLLAAGWAEDHRVGWLGIVCVAGSCAALLGTVLLVTADALPAAWQRLLLSDRLQSAPKRRLPGR